MEVFPREEDGEERDEGQIESFEGELSAWVDMKEMKNW